MVSRSLYTERHRTFVALLRQLRLDAGMTQPELAGLLDRSQSYVAKYERGEARLDWVQIDEICGALGLTISEFAARYDATKPATTDVARQPATDRPKRGPYAIHKKR